MLKKYNENWGRLDSAEEEDYLSRYNTFDVVGLPSGQVLFMNKKQLDWFEARKYISWKANIKSGGKRIRMGCYIFEDENLEDIKEKMDLISW